MQEPTVELFEYQIKAQLWTRFRGMKVSEIERLRILCADNAHGDHESVMVSEESGGRVPACSFCGRVLHPF